MSVLTAAFYAMMVCAYAFLGCMIIAFYQMAPGPLERLATIPMGGFLLLAPIVLISLFRRGA